MGGFLTLSSYRISEAGVKYSMLGLLLGLYFNQAPHNVSVIVAFFFCLLYCFSRKQYIFLLVKANSVFYVGLLGYLVFYTLVNFYHFGADAKFSYAVQRSRWLLYFLFILPALCIYLSRINDQNFRSLISNMYILMALVCAVAFIDSFARYFFSFNEIANFMGATHTMNFRPGWLYNPILFSKLSFFATVVFSLCYFVSSRISLKVVAAALALMMLFACFVTYVRGAWLGFIVLAIVAFIFLKKTRLPLVGVGVIVTCYLLLLPSDHMSQRLSSAVNMSGYSEIYRLEHWKANVKLSLDNPLVGVGYAANRSPEVLEKYLTRKGGITYGQPHNEYLDVLAGTGFIGLFLFLAILIVPVIYAIRLLHGANATTRQIVIHCIGFNIFMWVAIFFDRLGSLGWMCILFSWLPIFTIRVNRCGARANGCFAKNKNILIQAQNND